MVKMTFLHKPGLRVMALASAKNGVAEVYGSGVYEGDFPYGDTESTEPMSREQQAEHDLHVLDHGGEMCNPRIRLDNGKFVWGCECWWGPEEDMREEFKGCKLVEVDIEQHRRESGGGGVPSWLKVEGAKKGGS